jgi:formylmethanofuran dehydrogenase subunit E
MAMFSLAWLAASPAIYTATPNRCLGCGSGTIAARNQILNGFPLCLRDEKG